MPDAKKKILNLEEMAARAQKLQSEGKRVVLCHGTFDLLHMGHIRHLQRAREEGEVLFVSVTADQFVNKGPNRPVFQELLRAEGLASLACVDCVVVNSAVTAVNVISIVKPDFYVKGRDYENPEDDVTGNITHEQNTVETNGGKIVFTDDITFSSTSLLNEHFGVFSADAQSYLKGFSERWGEGNVIEMLLSTKSLNVLVVGDAIVDEYCFSTPLGQSAKGSHLAVKYLSAEKFAGGAIAVANHMAGFAHKVTLLSALGARDSYEDFIRSKLKENVEPVFFELHDSPTVFKRRFVDEDLNKFFEVYYYSENPPSESMSQLACSWLDSKVQDFDLVVSVDFGNGFVSQDMANILSSKSRFLAVNTQVNSGNRGYHVVTRYPKADFVSLNEPEVRMAAHNRHDSVEDVAHLLAEKLKTKYFAVTRGTHGAIILDKSGNVIHRVPALSTKVLDRVGAGDTFLSFCSLCLGASLNSEVAVFIGSAAAALDVQVVCNRDPIDPKSLLKYLGTLLR